MMKDAILPDAHAQSQLSLQDLAAIREGLASADRGELKTAQQVYQEMKAKYVRVD